MSAYPASNVPPRSRREAQRASGAHAAATSPRGPLQWLQVLDWLRADHILTEDAIKQRWPKLTSAHEKTHALARIGEAGLIRNDGSALGTDELCRWLAARAGLDYFKIDPLKVNIAKVGDVVSLSYATRYHILPVDVSNEQVVIATCEPFDVQAWEPELAKLLRRPIKLVVSSPIDIARYALEFMALSRSVKNAVAKGGGNSNSGVQQFEQLIKLGTLSDNIDANDQGVVQVVDWMWQYAFDQRASDIHLEPRRGLGYVRFRMDGVLQTVYQFPLAVMQALTNRVKMLARMDVVEKRRPQDGRIKVERMQGVDVEMRISSLPTAFGEKLVLRIFDPESVFKEPEQLGFPALEAERWQGLIQRPNGIILVTGPTGSGKTTTLYSTLKRLATDEVNVCTIEDPIEMVDNAFNQSQVQPSLQFTFAAGLRTLMRQDPDIIMVGEIRDAETAAVAVQAALTGHLVFSTLHTNDAASAISRLLELGVPSYLLNATLLGVLAQRLVRTLCVNCKAEEDNFQHELFQRSVHPWKAPNNFTPFKPVGCLECRNSGYRGRTGIYELLLMDDTMRQLVRDGADLAKLRTHAYREGLRPLRLAGAIKVAEGVTTLEEIMRETPPIELGRTGAGTPVATSSAAANPTAVAPSSVLSL